MRVWAGCTECMTDLLVIASILLIGGLVLALAALIGRSEHHS